MLEQENIQYERGICRLSVVPLRAAAAESSEQVSQLLYGDRYTVLDRSEDQKWLHICLAEDAYEGWIGSRLHTPIAEDFFQELEKQQYNLACGELCGRLRVRGSLFPLVYGSLLPFASTELFTLDDQLQYEGKSLEIKKINDPEVLKILAMPYLNAPYQWGGKSPFGIDCSGFTQMVYRLAGYRLKRDASQQARQGKSVSPAEARIGDLAFFANEAGRITHVGLLLDSHTIMHASGRVRIDGFDEKGIFVQENRSYTHQLCLVRRFIH